METLFWLTIVAAVWFAATFFWFFKEAVEHHFWEKRRLASHQSILEQQADMAAKAMQVNSQARDMMKNARRLPGDEWQSGETEVDET